jgi:hypothetical protein
VEQLLNFAPVDVTLIQSEREPTAVTVVWGQRESGVLAESVNLAGVGEKVERSSASGPSPARWGVRAVEQGEAPVADAEERTVLQLGLLGSGKGLAKGPNLLEGLFVVSRRA